MAAKTFHQSYKIVSAGDMSQATVASGAQNIQMIDNVGIQVNILTGTATGTFDVQVSADHVEVNNQIMTAGTWISLGTPYQAAITSGSPANVYFDINQHSSQYIRILWTKTSGTGTFDALIVGKGLQ
jgi:hypothetical protein